MIFFLCQNFSYDFFLMIFFLWLCVKKTQVFQEKLDSIGVQIMFEQFNWPQKMRKTIFFLFSDLSTTFKICIFEESSWEKKIHVWGQKLHDVIHILLLLSNEGTSECLSFCYFCEEVSPQFQSNHQVRTSSMAGNPAERNENEKLKKIMTSSIFESQDDHLI